ncbi:putative multiple-sugar transport system permease YteP [Clostridia bacterium]|nr:putative multiple-sugar transport system permease YteP [Clostridia bacterium]
MLSSRRLTTTCLKRRGKSSLYPIAPLYLMTLPAIAAVAVFAYAPMFGLLAAFKNYNIWKGFFNSPWAAKHGLANFIAIFSNKQLMGSIGSTIQLSLLNLATTLPLQLILALLFNELTIRRFKRTVQTITYMPHFLSWISIIGLTKVLLDEYGFVNELALVFNPNHIRTLYLSRQKLFVPLLVILNNWREIGYGSIFFLSAITAIDPQLYEAADVDGAGRLRQTWHITLPGISTTAVVLFILSIGSILGSNFDLVYGLRNPFILFDTIDTMVYKLGIGNGQYSLTIALGLARGLLALVLTLGVNFLSRKVNNVSVL